MGSEIKLLAGEPGVTKILKTLCKQNVSNDLLTPG